MRWQRGIAPATTDYAFDVLPRWPLTEVNGPAEATTTR
jgi:hypothetical protein